MHGRIRPVVGYAFRYRASSRIKSPIVRCSSGPQVHTCNLTSNHIRSFLSSASLACPSTPGITVTSMTTRRSHSTHVKETHQTEKTDDKHGHEHNHEHHSHSHSHSLYGSLTHSHSNGDEGHSHGIEALKSAGDKGSRVTLIGLGANVVLTTSKGLAGWFMNSASLLADAGHSLSDLLGDFVTLFCWRLSRRPPSDSYPYGFSKFETLGTFSVSILLTGGALAIGFHSYHLLIEALSTTIPTLPPGVLQDAIQVVSQTAQQVPLPEIGHDRSHGSSGQLLDPNAAWFAAVSVICKEWLYRITKRVADEERSSVLFANAIHHRSDAYSSLVAFVAIMGSWMYPKLPLDPIGGLLVSAVIFRQGVSLLAGSFAELTDHGVSLQTRQALIRALEPLLQTRSPFPIPNMHNPDGLLGIRDVRGVRAGATMFVDLIADVPADMSVHHATSLEERIVRTLKEARKDISEVRVKFNAVDPARNDQV